MMTEKQKPAEEKDVAVEKDVEVTAMPQEYAETTPLVDIIEQGGGVKVLMDVPGVVKESVALDVKDHMLTATADSILTREGRGLRFKRRFQISDEIDVSGITAKIDEGVLEIHLPKSESAKVHRIKVE